MRAVLISKSLLYFHEIIYLNAVFVVIPKYPNLPYKNNEINIFFSSIIITYRNVKYIIEKILQQK